MIPFLRPDRRSAVALAIVLIALAAGFRLLRVTLVPELPNFAPIMALALCGGLMLPRGLATVIPLTALVVTDVLLNLHYGVAPFDAAAFASYACYGLGIASGLTLRGLRAGLPLTFTAVTANSLLFYVVTNSVCWLDNPVYTKTFAGWCQALSVGEPGFPPTWLFLEHSLLSDLLFTGAFLAALHFALRSPVPAAARA